MRASKDGIYINLYCDKGICSRIMNKHREIKIDRRFWFLLAAVFAVGFIVHGTSIFSQVLYHDNLTLFGPGWTYESGRFMLQVLYKLELRLFGFHVNTKAFAAILSFSLIAVMCYIVAIKLDIKSKIALCLLGASFVTFPYVTSLFGFSFTAAYYCASSLSAVYAAALMADFSQKKDTWRIILSIIILGLSIGVYQSNLCVFIAALCCFAIRQTLVKENERWASFFIRCAAYLVSCVGGLLFYNTLNSVVLSIKEIKMTSYQAMDQSMNVSLSDFLTRILKAYSEFFNPSSGQTYSLYYSGPIRICYRIVVLMLVMCAILVLVSLFKNKQQKKALQLAMVFSVFPMSVCSTFLIADTKATMIYSLMLLSEIFVFVMLIYVMESVQRCGKFKYIYIFAASLICYASLYFAYVANICYTNDIIQHERAQSYYNRLITKIENLDNYNYCMPIAFINEFHKYHEEWDVLRLGQITRLPPYYYGCDINDYAWKEYVKVWLNWTPVYSSQEDIEELAQTPEVKDMPCYPNDGAIKIIDDVIVVKFGD